MIKVWGRDNSINVQKVLWTCHELGIAFERIDAGMQFGLTDTPAFLAMNPNGLVPVVDDHGFVLWESHAIVRYLARRAGQNSLWPADIQAAARVDQWMDWAATTLWPDLKVVFTNLVRRTPEQRDPAAIEQAMVGLCRHFTMLDYHLASQAWVAGQTMSLAEIPLGVMAYRWFGLDVSRPPSPHLQAWYERLQIRPGFQQYCAKPLT